MSSEDGVALNEVPKEGSWVVCGWIFFFFFF